MCCTTISSPSPRDDARLRLLLSPNINSTSVLPPARSRPPRSPGGRANRSCACASRHGAGLRMRTVSPWRRQPLPRRGPRCSPAASTDRARAELEPAFEGQRLRVRLPTVPTTCGRPDTSGRVDHRARGCSVRRRRPLRQRRRRRAEGLRRGSDRLGTHPRLRETVVMSTTTSHHQPGDGGASAVDLVGRRGDRRRPWPRRRGRSAVALHGAGRPRAAPASVQRHRRTTTSRSSRCSRSRTPATPSATRGGRRATSVTSWPTTRRRPSASSGSRSPSRAASTSPSRSRWVSSRSSSRGTSPCPSPGGASHRPSRPATRSSSSPPS